MEKFAAIVVSHTSKISREKGAATREVLYSKTVCWTEQALSEYSFSYSFLVEDASLLLSDIANSDLASWKTDKEVLKKEKIETAFLAAADSPLIEAKEILNSLIYHKSSGNKITLLSSFEDKMTGVGWYQLDELEKIMEKLGNNPVLQDYLEYLNNNDIQQSKFWVDDSSLMVADNSANRAEISRRLREKMIHHHLKNDVEIQVSDGVIIGLGVEIEAGANILKGTIIRGKSKISKDAIIGPNSEIIDSEIGVGSKIDSSQIEQSTVKGNSKIGPMSHLRPNSHIGDKVKIGNFVEIKNSNIGNGTSVSHLTYVGDSDVGESCNIGCGVVTVNYDGKNKHRTTIGNGVFVGCNCNLIAPVTMANHSYAAAGTTVTESVPESGFVIGRAKQTIKEGWVEEKKLFDK